MKKILTLFILLLTTTAYSQTKQGVIWFNGTFEEALLQANQTNKLLFVDCFTTHCGPCKYMADSVFTKSKAGDYFNPLFVCFKINMETKEGLELQKKWKCLGYPTFIIFDKEGKEINRIIGSAQLEAFITKVDLVKNPRNNPDHLIANYDKYRDFDDFIRYCEITSQSDQKGLITTFFNNYFCDLKYFQKINLRLWSYMSTAISLTEPNTLYHIINNKGFYDSNLGKGYVDAIVCNALENRLIFRYLINFYNETIDPKVIKDAYAFYKYINPGNYFNNIICKAIEAKINNDMEGMTKLLCNPEHGDYLSLDNYVILGRILNNMPVPQDDKDLFLKQLTDFYTERLKEVPWSLTYKRQNNVVD